MTTQIGPLDTSEVKPAYFKFTNELGTTNIASAVVTAELVSGNDSNPSALLSGGVTIDNTAKIVSQKVAGAGRAGNTYKLRCVATDADGNVHTVAALMEVQRI